MGCWGRVGEQVVDVAGDVPFQAAEDLWAGFSFCLSSGDIFFGGWVVTHPVGSDIGHSALFAWRLPPRLRRCRTVRPDDAGTGLGAYRAAKAVFVFIRPGLSPAVTSSAVALSGPTPEAVRRAGLVCAQRPRICLSTCVISVSRFWYRRARCPRTHTRSWSVLWLDGSGHKRRSGSGLRAPGADV